VGDVPSGEGGDVSEGGEAEKEMGGGELGAPSLSPSPSHPPCLAPEGASLSPSPSPPRSLPLARNPVSERLCVSLLIRRASLGSWAGYWMGAPQSNSVGVGSAGPGSASPSVSVSVSESEDELA